MLAIDALVIQSRKSGENDVVLTLLTAEHGRVYVCAKGGRSTKSDQLPLAQLFTYSNLELYEKNGRRWLKGGSVIRSFYGLSSRLESLAVASYMAETVLEFTSEGVPAEEELRLMLNMLYTLAEEKRPPRLVKAVWEFRLSVISGYAPDLGLCAGCRSDSPEILDVGNGHVLCRKCYEKQNRFLPKGDERPEGKTSVLLRPAALLALRTIAEAHPKQILAFSLQAPEDLDCLCRASEAFFLYHVGHGFSTLDFYHSVCN
ncbi:MAG: DNA repair protein RecO [Clostridia bacterium]|nr:DNA repair protein RecO [Clostridia bacterium]